QVFYVKVQGADSTAMSTGAYALTLNFGTGASPTVPLPNTQTLNGNPISSGGGLAQMGGDDDPGVAAGGVGDSFAAADKPSAPTTTRPISSTAVTFVTVTALFSTAPTVVTSPAVTGSASAVFVSAPVLLPVSHSAAITVESGGGGDEVSGHAEPMV